MLKAQTYLALKLILFCDQTIDNITKYPCDVLVLSSFGKIIPKELLDYPNYYAIKYSFLLSFLSTEARHQFNQHYLNGDIKTGISFMEMIESLDEGPVYDVSEVEISDSDNRISLEKKLVAKAKLSIVRCYSKNF